MAVDTVETPQDIGRGAKPYIADIEAYEKEYRPWVTRGRKIIKRFRDERDHSTSSLRRFNVLWSNIQVLKPALYARTPKSEVVRRHKDKDPVGRIAAEILERTSDTVLDLQDFDGTMRTCLDDYLLPGRGTIWVSYSAEFEDVEAPNVVDQEGQPVTSRVKRSEKVEPEYVNWQDFGHSPARTWGEVTKVWRCVYLTRKQLVERFGAVGRRVPLDHGPEDEDAPEGILRKAKIYEVWCKTKREVVWVHKGMDNILDETPDPLGLEKFWPCPRPLYSTTTTGTLVPVPDYAQYQDQAEEIDRLTQRIHNLTDALKVVGVYDSSVQELGRLLQRGGVKDNTLIPVKNWAAFADKGGLQGATDFVPFREVVEALQGAYAAREQAKQVLFEVTGLSDILRGATDPNETARAQTLKGQFGSIRIRDRQAEIARFAADAIRIVSEIAAEMFEPETLWQMSNAQSFTDENMFMQAVQLLRNEKLRNFRIDIESDSTIQLNENEEKQNRLEFVQSFGGLLQQALPVIQAAPQMAPVVSEVMLYAVRGFKAGRQLEGVIEQMSDSMVQQAQQPQGPSLEEQELQLKARELQGNQAMDQARLQLDAQKVAIDAAQAGQPAGVDPLEVAKVQNEAQRIADARQGKQLDAAVRLRTAQMAKEGQEAPVDA